ncbi:2713_t:CDS:1, partial [Paraglomus occultum]
KEKCNSREIEVKQKEVITIEEELRKKLENEFSEEKIFGTCKKIAELNFQLEQSRYEETQNFDETNQGFPPNDY